MFSKPQIQPPSGGPSSTAVPAPTPSRRRFRWARRFLILLAALLAGAWFAPAIASRTGLPNQAAREALAGFHGTIEIGGASLGWFSPIELRDLVIKDSQGRTLLTAPRITSSKSLASLLRDRSDLGEFTLEQPAVAIVFENGSTNLEESLAEFLKDESPPGPSRSAVAIHVIGGQVALQDGEKQSVFESVEATIGIAASRSEPIAVKARASAAQSAGALETSLSLGEKCAIQLQATGFPLDSLGPVLKRAGSEAALGGTATANLHAEWSRGEPGRLAAAVDGVVSLHDFDLSGPSLHGEHLRLASAELPVHARLEGSSLHVKQAELKCDVGSLSASGTFDVGGSPATILDQPGVKIEGNLDLAKLASMLPRLFHTRQGTEIQEGHLALKLASRSTGKTVTWDGQLGLSSLQAVREGKPILWKQPLKLEFSGRAPPGHLPTFDRFICQSDFMAINAQGSPASFRAAVNVYLDRLADQLEEFVELKGAKLAGEGSAWIIATRTPQGDFKASAGMELKQFAFTDGTHRGINEQALTLKCSGVGRWPAHGAVRFDTGSLDLAVGADHAEARILEPIPDLRHPSAGAVSLRIAGDLGRWMTRVRGFVGMPRYQYGGATIATGALRFTPDSIALEGISLGIDQARFRGAGIDLNEPRLDASANLAVKKSEAAFSQFRIASELLKLAEGTLAIATPPDGPLAVRGGGNSVVNLGRLGRTLHLQSDPRGSDALNGLGTGPLSFRWQGGTTTFGARLAIKNFAYGDPRTTGLSDSMLKVDLDAQYEESPDRLTFHHAKVEATGLALDAKGSFARLSTEQDLTLEGTIAYDLEKLGPEIGASLGGGFQASGKGSRPFTFSGSLGSANFFAKLTARGGIAWDSLRFHGFAMGPGELDVNAANGKAAISPIHATFGGGRITMTPAVRLDPPPPELAFQPGAIVDHAKLTPATCAGALGYALPVLANAAQAEGEISAILGENHIPIYDPNKASLKGQIIVHQAAIGPGPVVSEILVLTGSNSTTMTLAKEMRVPIRIEKGRVYHENLAITVNGYAIKTSGSVGMDGSLALVADIPIPGTFPGLKNNPVLKKALEGRIIQVPLGGTVARPMVDRNAFRVAVERMARDSVRDVGRQFFRKELDKLLPLRPRK